MPLACSNNCGGKAAMKRPKTGEALCQPCFFAAFEAEVHETIVEGRIFSKGDFVAVAASGGKDSTVLAYVLKLLNDRHEYGLRLVLLSIDEGITGYRDDSLETVKRNETQYGMPLTILSYKDLYGWTMDEIVREVGRKNNCTFCGVFRRQALDRGAMLLGVKKIVTGHNADDVAETVLMNLLRGDVARLQRCTAIVTGREGALPRCKPFKYTYEKEIVMYAYYKKLDYFSTECIYSPNAYRGHARTLIKDLEKARPSSIIDIIHSGESLSIKEGTKMSSQSICTRCKYISSQPVCKACVLLEGLNKGLPKLGIGKSSKVKERLGTPQEEDSACGSKTACCGSGKKCHSSTSVDEEDEASSVPKKKGRRSSKKKDRLDLRRNLYFGMMDSATTENGTPKESSTTEDNNHDHEHDIMIDAYEEDEDSLGEFFGCGGFSSDKAYNNSGDLDLPHQNGLGLAPVEDDIENLGRKLQAVLHVANGGKVRGTTT